MRDSAQLSATASLSPTLSVASARQLRGRFEQEHGEQSGGGLRGLITLVALLSLLVVPVATVKLTNGWPLDITLRHFAAAAGCEAARAVDLAPARPGQPGYWPWLDRSHSGISCAPTPP